MKKPTSRRLRLVAVGEHALLETLIFAGSGLPDVVQAVQLPGLPDDAEVVGCHHEPRNRAFVFHIESASYDEVPPGATVPYDPSWQFGATVYCYPVFKLQTVTAGGQTGPAWVPIDSDADAPAVRQVSAP